MKSPSNRLPLPSWIYIAWNILAVSSFVCGVYGFSTQELAGGERPTLLDAIYRALLLFAAQGGEIVKPNLFVQLARIGAVLSSASGLALLVRFWYLFQRLRLSLATDHAVVCGLGKMGRRFARQLRQSRNEVVIIEQLATNAAVFPCQNAGMQVLIGDAADPELLRLAKAATAKSVLCLADDETNLKIADRLGSLVSTRSRPPHLAPLRVFLHLTEEKTLLLQRSDVFHENSGRYEPRLASAQIGSPVVDVFNMHELAARLMLDSRQHSFLAAGEILSQRDTLAFVGWDPWNQFILLEAVNRWRRSDNWKNGKKLTVLITHADRDTVKELWRTFLEKHESLRVMCEVTGVEETSMINKLNDHSLLFISMPHDRDSFSYARKYCQPSGKLPCPAILAIKEAWSPDAENVPKHNLLYAYEIQDRACMPENLDSIGIVEQIGRAIHEQYLRDQVRAGFAMGSKPAMKSWEELDPTFRTSSNFQAASIVGNLQQSDYDLEAMTSLGQAYVDIDKEDVVPLAQREHERYCQERVLTDSAAANWTWEQLKEGDRNTTCDQVRSWPWILAQQGILLKKRNRT